MRPDRLLTPLTLFALPALFSILLAVAVVPRPALADSGERAAAEARDIAKVLKCPVCQNLSVADSPSELAQQMRELIAKKLAAGETRDQIVAYFVDRYGEQVLLDPPSHGFNRLLWWGPLVALAGGLLVVGVTLRQWLRAGAGAGRRPPAPAPDLSPEEEQAYLALVDERRPTTDDGQQGGRSSLVGRQEPGQSALPVASERKERV